MPRLIDILLILAQTFAFIAFMGVFAFFGALLGTL